MARNIFARKRSGLFAKRAGDWFEAWLKTACQRRGWVAIKIPSGCEWVSAGKAKPVRTPFDFVFTKNNISIFGDAKTTMETNYSFSKITGHQLASLLEIENVGSIAGYIVNFREQNQTVFFTAGQLSSLKRRCSLAPTDGIMIGNNQDILLDTVAVKFARVYEKT